MAAEKWFKWEGPMADRIRRSEWRAVGYRFKRSKSGRWWYSIGRVK